MSLQPLKAHLFHILNPFQSVLILIDLFSLKLRDSGIVHDTYGFYNFSNILN